MKPTLGILFALFFARVCGEPQQQSAWGEKDRQIFEQLPSEQQSVEAWAMYFVGTPYQAATLENANDSTSVVNLRVFDCTTFVENVLALSFIDRLQLESFAKKLTDLRYRDGIPQGYPSRLHYFSEWISNNESKGFVTDITEELGGENLLKKIDFMTKHRKFYPALEKQVFFNEIRKVEERLSGQLRFVIPKTKISMIKEHIRVGDIIAFATDIKGLDFVHLGFVIRDEKDDTIHLLHASNKAGGVVISQKTLAEYALQRSDVSGIVILRVAKK